MGLSNRWPAHIVERELNANRAREFRTIPHPLHPTLDAKEHAPLTALYLPRDTPAMGSDEWWADVRAQLRRAS